MHLATETVKADKVKNTIKIVVGIMIAIFFSMGACGFFMEYNPKEIPVFIFVVAIAICGLWLALSGFKGNKLVGIATRCNVVIGNSWSYNISQLATELNIPKAELRKKLENMFARRYFPSARFDNTGEQISFGKPGSNAGIYGGETVSVICASCGGVNHVLRKKGGACEYCGAPLSGK